MKTFILGAFVAMCVAIVLFVILRVVLYQGPETVLVSPSSASEDNEVTALRALLEESHRTNDKILVVLYGTLSLLGLVAAGLIGFNIYQFRWSEPENRRVAMKTIRSELMTILEERLKSQEKRQEDLFRNAIEHIAQRLNRETERNTSWRKKQSFEFKRKTQLARKTNQAYMDFSRDIVESRFETLDRNLKMMQYQVLADAIQESLFKSEFVSTYQTSRLLELGLQLTLDSPYDSPYLDFNVTRALDLMRKSLPHALIIDEMELNRLRVLLDNLPEKYAGSRDTIIPLLAPMEMDVGRLIETSAPSEGANTAPASS